MTEDEAKTKWCPFARVPRYDEAVEATTPINRNSLGMIDIGSRCLGSDCMAWRVTVEALNKGYCGLAGVDHAE